LHNTAILREHARRMSGQPVCVVLKDGSYYVGWITDVQKDQIWLSGHKGTGYIPESRIKRGSKAETSAWMADWMIPAFGGGADGFPFGFQAPGSQPASFGSPAGIASGNGFLNMLKSAWPSIQMGINMVRTIMPLLSGLRL